MTSWKPPFQAAPAEDAFGRHYANIPWAAWTRPSWDWPMGFRENYRKVRPKWWKMKCFCGISSSSWGIPKSWLVYFMEHPIVRNGWWLGVPLWLRKPPCSSLICWFHLVPRPWWWWTGAPSLASSPRSSRACTPRSRWFKPRFPPVERCLYSKWGWKVQHTPFLRITSPPKTAKIGVRLGILPDHIVSAQARIYLAMARDVPRHVEIARRIGVAVAMFDDRG